ncbi:cell division ATP-binding protein FtsE [Corynebacterium doosanense]|uniref:Cell division ATP-binding protein FtsE n=1 Tax=Corynebacterium doosanense CAU 212 = DSM 45436 TaxID=558173 RepID=A0A097IED0_9CORY|nr:cell division ATP-binding protein FtsE [Corynebacterium doosanense]AIT60489.1 hypothetical protein CDOO_03910 [Corynebacterium doosanense CAU 212 = DSM 45436]
MIIFDNVTKAYPGTEKPALDGVNLEVAPGEFVFFIGPSGSGKSTLFNLLIREENVTSGNVHFDGLHVNTLKDREVSELRQRIGYVFQDFRLLPLLSVHDNVAFALEVIGKSKAEIAHAVPEALEMVGLAAKGTRRPRELSGGEQQRVAIARALVNKPRAVLADEPTGNLDPETADEIMGLFTEIHSTGTTVLMSTHNSRTVDSLRHRVLEMRDGKFVRDDDHGMYHSAETGEAL